MTSELRLSRGGRIDRTRPLSFVLDHRRLEGYVGDTLASALLANGVQLVGRSFKYHRPRGFLAAGVEEPNGLLTIGEGARRTPNVPATTTELYDGLFCRRQNGWPSVDFDIMALTSWLSPLFGAGFYYKTFMGPRRGSWMMYEPFIRRAAGLGEATHLADPDRYETRHAHADVLVVGAGPAGLAAARAAGRTGCRVTLVEQDFELGGSLLSAPVGGADAGLLASLVADLATLPNVEVLTRTTALGVYDDSTVVLVERHDHARPDPSKGQAREVVVTLHAGAIVHATGAIERSMLFGDNDRPGVLLASAIRTYLNRYAVQLGRDAVIATNNDSAWATALDLAAAGVRVTMLDERAAAGAGLADRARRIGVDVRHEVRVARALGGRAVQGVEYATRGGAIETLRCDVLGISGGWTPTVHLTSHTGPKPAFDVALDAFLPGPFAAGHAGAGAMMGTRSLKSALGEGHAAGEAAARHVGATAGIGSAPACAEEWPTGHVPSPPDRLIGRGKAFIDFQNDVTTKDVALAHEEGYHSVEHLKRFTTQGMGTDQGKTSNVDAAKVMASLRGIEMSAAGTTTYRPPYTPVSVGALAGRSVGAHFRARRLTPMHDWHLANGAVMIQAGPWLRPWYYQWAGKDVGSAYVDEMKLVRGGVGISDVSSLGKIDVRGPDAAIFLDRVYVNGFAKLPVGKARYGVMLNDDATVLDDGTTARFGEHTYFMTTTTAQAGEVMSWLEFLLQVAWPDLRVQVASVTDRWAGMSVAGPRARDALAMAFPGQDLASDALPYMGVREFGFVGATVRILRLSFSGELAYEVYVPADEGTAMWTHILAQAAPLGIRPYGLESLASLRIEKGHVAGLELDHRNTLDDLGLGRMASKTKAYIGRELASREFLRMPGRWSLVGLELLEPTKRLRGGSILFRQHEALEGHGRGYITSVTWSTERRRLIALALFEGGLEHEGEEIVCAYPLRNEIVRARIVSPMFIDPAGERVHA
jgi:sarcosine oxidase subunit alpha